MNNALKVDKIFNWQSNYLDSIRNNNCHIQIYSPLYDFDVTTQRIKEKRRYINPKEYELVIASDFDDHSNGSITTEIYSLASRVILENTLLIPHTIWINKYEQHHEGLFNFDYKISLVEINVNYIGNESFTYYPVWQDELDYLITGDPLYFRETCSSGWEKLYTRWKSKL
jgi:hypothetical protein